MAKEDWRKIKSAAGFAPVMVGEEAAQAWTLYEANVAAYKAHKAAKEAFEAFIQAGFAGNLPDGWEVKFGYNWGLSIAVGPINQDKAAKASPKAPEQDLGDWIKDKAADGFAV